MKYFATIFYALLLFCVGVVHPQGDSRIIRFDGGKIDLNFAMTGGLFSGIGGSSAGVGASIASFAPAGADGFWNPALLSSLNRFEFQIDAIPPINLSLDTFLDMPAEVQASTDNAIKDYKDASLVPTYSRIYSKIAQQDQLNAAVFTVPHRFATFSIYFVRPFEMDFRSKVSGIQAKILTTLSVSEGDDEVFLNSYVDGHLSLALGVNTIGLAAGKRINDLFDVGLAIERYDARLRSKGLFNVDGTMLFGGKENTFNDPNDAWHNDLNQFIDATYRGSDWGWKLGGSYSINPDFQVSGVFIWAPDITNRGSMKLINNTIPALNIDLMGQQGEQEQDILDPEKLKLSQLTLTREVDNKVYPSLQMRLPKILRIGAAYRVNWFAVHFSYSMGFSPLSFVYGKDEIGVKPAHTFLLGFNLKYVQMGLGLSVLKKVAKGSENLGEDGLTSILPLFTIGSQAQIGEAMNFYFSLLSLPLPCVKISFGYKF